MSSHTESLVRRFAERFDVQFVRTRPQFEQMYRIRGDVYCKEFRFEPEENCPGGLEFDEHYKHSVHCLIVHRASRLPAGCVRLILAPDERPDSRSLPAEGFCTEQRLRDVLGSERPARLGVAEVSRLAIHPLFRRRDSEHLNAYGISAAASFGDDEWAVFPLMTTALFVAAVSLGAIVQRCHGYVMMEPRLARLLKRAGLNFIQVGDLSDYHGLRAAFYLSLEDAYRGVRHRAWHMFAFVHQRLQEEFNRAYTDRPTKPAYTLARPRLDVYPVLPMPERIAPPPDPGYIRRRTARRQSAFAPG